MHSFYFIYFKKLSKLKKLLKLKFIIIINLILYISNIKFQIHIFKKTIKTQIQFPEGTH
jgi:hypothetical protein